MKIGLFTYGYMHISLEQAFKDAASFGYDGVEIWGGRPHAYPYDLKEEGVEEILELSKKYQMPIIGYTPEMNMYPYNMMIGNEKIRKNSVDYIKVAMDITKGMDAGFTMISAGHAGHQQTSQEVWKRLIQNLDELASYAEKIGVDLVLEPLTSYESNVLTTCDELVKALDQVNSPRLHGICDVVPPFCNGEPIMSYFEKLGNRMRHMHIVDSDGVSESHMIPGDGKIPLRQLFKDIEAEGYDGYGTIELISASINDLTGVHELAIKRVKELLRPLSM